MNFHCQLTGGKNRENRSDCSVASSRAVSSRKFSAPVRREREGFATVGKLGNLDESRSCPLTHLTSSRCIVIRSHEFSQPRCSKENRVSVPATHSPCINRGGAAFLGPGEIFSPDTRSLPSLLPLGHDTKRNAFPFVGRVTRFRRDREIRL